MVLAAFMAVEAFMVVPVVSMVEVDLAAAATPDRLCF